MDASVPLFRLYQPRQPALALGLATHYLMTKPAFANLKFGEWSRVLTGQINRRHFCFAIDAANRIVGFAGWAATTRDKAEAWLESSAPLSNADSIAGDCLIFNAWSADSLAVHRFMVDEARKLIRDKETLYFRRFYADGTFRSVRLNVNDFVGSHIARRGAGPEPSPGLPHPNMSPNEELTP